MLRNLVLAAVIGLATPAMAHDASKFHTGPNGGHLVDVVGGEQHWELVAAGNELTLYVTDGDDKPVDIAGGRAEAQVLVSGKTHRVEFTPAGGNTMKATGDFTAAKGMKVILKTDGIAGKSFQARLTPLK
ncbi:MAG: hypothetical protein ACK4MF_08780 [Hyphomicrobiaceae bacterium]